MSDDVRSFAVALIEAVKAEDEDWVRQILSSECAGEVAVEVARMAGRARRDAAEADQRLVRFERIERDYALAGEANRRLIAERADLRQRVEELRAMKGL